MTDQLIRNAILKGLEAEADKIADEELRKMQERIRDRMRRAAAQVAVTLVTSSSFESFGRDLRITLRMDGPPERTLSTANPSC
jgi:hypothetical protein